MLITAFAWFTRTDAVTLVARLGSCAADGDRATEIQQAGSVRLISPQYAKSCVKGGKNDRSDKFYLLY